MSATELLALLILILLIAAALVLFLPLRRGATPSGADPEIERLDSRNWYLGVFYYNPDDPAVFVPKRLGLGWTINFAHPGGKVMAAVIVALILLPIALAIFDPGLRASSIGCHPGNCP
ncbi:MAG: DUF5808 domain-containing protein [Ktedonobacterales bacterium]